MKNRRTGGRLLVCTMSRELTGVINYGSFLYRSVLFILASSSSIHSTKHSNLFSRILASQKLNTLSSLIAQASKAFASLCSSIFTYIDRVFNSANKTRLQLVMACADKYLNGCGCTSRTYRCSYIYKYKPHGKRGSHKFFKLI